MARHLRIDLTQKDVKARILDYFDSMEEVIEVHGLGVSLRNNVKLKCKVLVENLRPSTLKDQVKRAIEYDPSLKANVHRLFDLVKQEAIRNQQAFDLYQRTDNVTRVIATARSKRRNSTTLVHTIVVAISVDQLNRHARNVKACPQEAACTAERVTTGWKIVRQLRRTRRRKP
ncbi:unnamed protein product [Phytophthora lilii]|uniref:Unnamed protein product n=1 Tax=Phytophthora lilii TaxID=2077276 RepID=A0A9W6U7T6_9STRA|nr:unnamed protein product [Phytophthora lilii]